MATRVGIWVRVGACLLVSACSGTLATPTYQPGSILELAGAVEILPFEYSPPVPLAPNELHSDALATWYLEVPIATYFTKALQQEFRQSGLSLAPGAKCQMAGKINDLRVDPLKSSSSGDVHYRLTRDSTVLFEEDVKTLSHLPMLTHENDLMTGASNAVAVNIGQLLGSPKLQAAIKENCQ